jgi:hypothetical protein
MCQSLIQTVPASSWLATASARAVSELQTPAESPYSVSLSMRKIYDSEPTGDCVP